MGSAVGIAGVPLTRFVGRGAELAELTGLLQGDERLVTLLGAGGVGKSRLAMELADRAGCWADEVVVVELAALASGELVDGALFEATGTGAQSGRSALDATVEHLRDRSALLILDTCEHVLASAARVAQRLVAACRKLRVLVTSRVPLGVPGEVVWPVPSLTTRAPAGAGEAAVPDAVLLFADRASLALPCFRLDPTTAPAVERIVEGVDGIPLAIELAASRLRVLAPEEIAAGLADHLQLLGGGPRGPDRRHHTMRASLDWSHALLDPGLAVLFARLSIFAGRWTLDAAEAVCPGAELGREDVLDGIAGLVDRSLIVAERDSDGTRYRMLDFVRQYARELLAADPAAEDVALRHRRYFRDLAECADRELWAVRPEGRALLDAEAPNLRDAVVHACRDGDADALRLVAALADLLAGTRTPGRRHPGRRAGARLGTAGADGGTRAHPRRLRQDAVLAGRLRRAQGGRDRGRHHRLDRSATPVRTLMPCAIWAPWSCSSIPAPATPCSARPSRSPSSPATRSCSATRSPPSRSATTSRTTARR